MNDFASVLRGLDWSVPVQLLLSVLPALICITLHECAHGMTAYMLGDDTAKRAGRLSLNPIKHIDVLGLVMLVVFRFGWAKPVPVNMNRSSTVVARSASSRAFRWGMALTAAAGPLANLVISIIALFIYGLLFIPLGRYEWGWYLLETVYVTAYLSLTLALFNIIPIPPLDGSKVLYSAVSERSYRRLMYYERYGMIALLILVVVMNRLPFDPLSAAADWVFDRIFIAAELGYDLVRLFV